MSNEANETVYLQEAGVTVTNARFVTADQTFAMRNVSAVKLTVQPARRMGGLIVGSILVLLGLPALVAGVWALGLVLAPLGGLLVWLALRKQDGYAVVVTTNGGDAQALQHTDRGLIERVVAAINQAIIARG